MHQEYLQAQLANKDSVSYYEVSTFRDVKCENWYEGPKTQTFIKTNDLVLAQEVFIFQLTGKTKHQKLTPFQRSQIISALQTYSVQLRISCNCGQHTQTLSLESHQIIFEKHYNFNVKIDYPFIYQYQYDRLVDAGQIVDNQEGQETVEDIRLKIKFQQMKLE